MTVFQIRRLRPATRYLLDAVTFVKSEIRIFNYYWTIVYYVNDIYDGNQESNSIPANFGHMESYGHSILSRLHEMDSDIWQSVKSFF